MTGSKTTPLVLALVLFTVPCLVAGAFGATIRNRLNQRLTIQLSGGRTVSLLSQGTAEVATDDLSSPNLRDLIARGSVAVVADAPPQTTPTPTPTPTPPAPPAPATPRFEGAWRVVEPRDTRLAKEELRLERDKDGTLTARATAGLGKVSAVHAAGRRLKVTCLRRHETTRLTLTLSADDGSLRGRVERTAPRTPSESSPCRLERSPEAGDGQP